MRSGSPVEASPNVAPRRRRAQYPLTRRLHCSLPARTTPRTRLLPSARRAKPPNSACGFVPQVDACSPPATANEHINVLFTGLIKARCAGRPLEPRALPCTRLCRPRTLWHLCMSSVPITMTARWHAHAVNTRVCCLQLRASIVVSDFASQDAPLPLHLEVPCFAASARATERG